MAKFRPGGRKTARRAAKRPPTGKPVIQSCLRIWGTYDPIESGPSEPKKWGFHRCSVKKCRFSGQKWAPAAGSRPAVQRGQHKNVAFLVSSHDGDKKIGRFPKKMDFGPKNCIFGPKFCIFLRYTYETPIFLAQTVPTQWDHKSPISWGNSWYLWFSGRCPFGCSAGRCMAPIAENYHFWVKNAYY